MDSKPVRIEELLAHAGWVRRLAARLVRDAGSADDVAQEVWAYALRSPPRDRSNLRAWLSAAVRNAARSLQRSQSRRAEREAAVAPRGHEPAAAELVERAHLHRDLVEQVLALGEPHRSIVLAHWFEEQSLAEIARRQGLTERVVKSRLDAAHATLRQRMDKAAGGRSVWSLAFLKWTNPHLATGATAGAGTALTLGGLVVASKLVVGSVAVVLAAGLGWMLWPHSEPAAPLASDRTVPIPESATTDGPSTELPASASTSTRESLAAAAPKRGTPAAPAAERWVVRGRVHGAPAGRETETKLTAMFLGRFNITDAVSGFAASDGSFEIDVSSVVQRWLRSAEPNELRVEVVHPVCQLAESRVPFASAHIEASAGSGRCAEFRCDFELVSAAVLTGRIDTPADWKPVEEQGRPPARPRLGLFDFASGAPHLEQGLAHTSCDADGRWTLRVHRSGEFTLVACADGLHPLSRAVKVVLGQSVDIGSIELTRGVSISGTVRRAGHPIGAGAEVSAEAKRDSGARISILSPEWRQAELYVVDGIAEYARIRATTIADGSYAIEGLAPVDYDVSVAQNPVTRMTLGSRRRIERTVRAPQSGVDLDGVPPTIELALTVNGRPPTDEDLEGVVVDLVPLSDGSSRGEINLTREAQGYGKIQLVAGIAYELRVRPARYAASVQPIGALEFGEERTFALDLKLQDQASTLVVRFVTEKPEDLAWATFGFSDPSKAPGERSEIEWVSEDRTPDGTFVLRNRQPGTYRVRACPYKSSGTANWSYYMAAEFEVVLSPKATVSRELQLERGGRVRLSAKDEHGSFVRTPIELRNARGEQVPTEFFCLVSGGTYGCGWYLCEQGPNDHPPLPAGHYEFTLKAEGFANEVVGVDLVVGETKTLEVVLHPR
jgi:RNA polymerase sigma factor (sigma-70 family)